MIAFNWLAEDLPVSLMWRLKLSLSCNWTPNGFSDDTTPKFCWSIKVSSFVWSLLLLSFITAWNLSELTVILFSLNQFTVFADSDSKVPTRCGMILAKVVKKLSSTKL